MKKTLRFEKPQTATSPDSNDCTAAILTGNIPFIVKDSTLTVGIGADGKATDAKAAGIKFTKVDSADKLAQAEKDFRANSPEAKLKPTLPDATPKSAADVAKQSNADKATMTALAGNWILKADDKVANAKLSAKITKTNYELITFRQQKIDF